MFEGSAFTKHKLDLISANGARREKSIEYNGNLAGHIALSVYVALDTLVKYGCQKGYSILHCKCMRAGMPWMEMCACGNECSLE